MPQAIFEGAYNDEGFGHTDEIPTIATSEGEVELGDTVALMQLVVGKRYRITVTAEEITN